MDIVVSGRNVEVPEHYRQHVAEKLSRIERFDHKVIRVDVELQHEPNRRQSSACQHVEITCKSRGPVVRSEACAADFYAALDAAAGKLEARLRRAADRRRVHYGKRRTKSVSEATTEAELQALAVEAASLQPIEDESAQTEPVTSFDQVPSAEAELDGVVADGVATASPGEAGTDEPGQVVRRKDHDAVPMSIDQALHEMELVGHDFYLFADVDSGLPSVVYRRRGYAYGVIRLNTAAQPATDPVDHGPAVATESIGAGAPSRDAAYAAR